MSVERTVREVLSSMGGIMSAVRHPAIDTMHLDGWVVEVLEGAVNDSNRTFLASRLSRADRVSLVVWRRQVLQEGDGFSHASNGRAFVLDQTPKTTADGSLATDDLPPIALYFASGEPVVELGAETMDAVPRPPRRAAIDDGPLPRRRVTIPV